MFVKEIRIQVFHKVCLKLSNFMFSENVLKTYQKFRSQKMRVKVFKKVIKKLFSGNVHKSCQSLEF